MDDSTHREENGSGGSSTASELGSLATEGRRMSGRSSTPGLHMSARTPLPVVGALLLDLPGIIQEAAGEKGLPVPQPAPPPSDDLEGRYGSAHSRCPDPIWPQFPAVMTYLSEAAAEPAKIRAPVST